MLGKTHIAVGVATSLAIIRPETTTGVISSILGGAIGGWICDIDIRKNKNTIDVLQSFIIVIVLSAVCIFIDYRIGNGICNYLSNSFNAFSILELLLFLIGIIYGVFMTKHRGFMHSLFAAFYFSIILWLLYPQISIPFGIGFLTHIILDITNKKGLQLFFPFKKKICFNLCSSDGTTNKTIMYISIILTSVLIGWFAINSLPTEHLISYNIKGNLPLFTKFQWYLITINIISFIVMVTDCYLCSVSWFWDSNQEFIHTLEHILGLAGGGLGVLISFIVLKNTPNRDNYNWYLLVISEILCWTTIFLIICNPFNIVEHQPILLPRIILILFIIIINSLCFILFMLYKNKNGKNIQLMLIGVLGGAIGGILGMMLTGKKSSLPEFSIGFPIIIIVHSFIIGYLFLYVI